MDFTQFGLQALKVYLDYKSNAELNEAQRERDVYKQKAEDLSSKLDNMKRKNSTTHQYKSNFNNGSVKTQSSSHGSRGATRGITTYSKSMSGRGSSNPVQGKANAFQNSSGTNTSYNQTKVHVKVQNSNGNPSPGRSGLQNSRPGRGRGRGNSRPVC